MALNAKANANYVPKRINGKFAPGYSGNPGGSLEATRRSFNKDFLLALAADFKCHGPQAIEKVRKQQPAAYLKICALLVPREMKLECSSLSGEVEMTRSTSEVAVCSSRASASSRLHFSSCCLDWPEAAPGRRASSPSFRSNEACDRAFCFLRLCETKPPESPPC
jgi:hypothetical protein